MRHSSPIPFLLFLASPLLPSLETASAATLFQQDFQSSSTVSDYVTGGAATGSLFSTIGTDPSSTGFSQAINAGALAFNSAAAAVGAQGARATFASTQSIVQSQFTLNIGASNTGTVDRSRITFGTSAVVNGNYASTGGNTAIFADFLARTVTGGWRFDLENTAGRFITGLPLNSDVTFRIYLNDSGSTISGITSPVSGTFSLADNSASVFYNTGSGWVLGIDNQIDSGKTGTIGAFRLSQLPNATTGSDVRLDNIIMTDNFSPIPEPSPLSLFYLATVGLALVTRIRRRNSL